MVESDQEGCEKQLFQLLTWHACECSESNEIFPYVYQLSCFAYYFLDTGKLFIERSIMILFYIPFTMMTFKIFAQSNNCKG